ncbi:MAG: dipicolinate synthase subunit DpsA [Oscillospiraceae bacterium]|nr:dipicolinate synthase subunit DpsA [Oscillospiraceae bacterium]
MQFAVIGGDNRQGFLVNLLTAKGYSVNTYGLEKFEHLESSQFSGSLSGAVSGADVIILPLPITRNGVTINAPFAYSDIYLSDVIALFKKNQLILGGKVPEYMFEAAATHDIKLYDYLNREEMSVLNAIPTAEGAIEIAMRETDKTIFGSSCLCIGYGRIGKALSSRLHALGANVTSSARKFSDIAWITSNGMNSVRTDALENELNKFDLIFNTVPHLIMDSKNLDKCKSTAVIIDLASAPGGVDYVYAHTKGLKALAALSLPGKVAPITAAEIMLGAIINMVYEYYD